MGIETYQVMFHIAALFAMKLTVDLAKVHQ